MRDPLVDAVEALTRLAESGRDDPEARAEWQRQYARIRIRLAELLTPEQAAVVDEVERATAAWGQDGSTVVPRLSPNPK